MIHILLRHNMCDVFHSRILAYVTKLVQLQIQTQAIASEIFITHGLILVRLGRQLIGHSAYAEILFAVVDS